jgi:hypothetical protein
MFSNCKIFEKTLLFTDLFFHKIFIPNRKIKEFVFFVIFYVNKFRMDLNHYFQICNLKYFQLYDKTISVFII